MCFVGNSYSWVADTATKCGSLEDFHEPTRRKRCFIQFPGLGACGEWWCVQAWWYAAVMTCLLFGVLILGTHCVWPWLVCCYSDYCRLLPAISLKHPNRLVSLQWFQRFRWAIIIMFLSLLLQVKLFTALSDFRSFGFSHLPVAGCTDCWRLLTSNCTGPVIPSSWVLQYSSRLRYGSCHQPCILSSVVCHVHSLALWSVLSVLETDGTFEHKFLNLSTHSHAKTGCLVLCSCISQFPCVHHASVSA